MKSKWTEGPGGHEFGSLHAEIKRASIWEKWPFQRRTIPAGEVDLPSIFLGIPFGASMTLLISILLH